MINTKNLLLAIMFIIAATTTNLTAQCGTWSGLDNMDEITDAHSVYRDLVKAKNFEGAYEYWKVAYDAAPAADGKRASHFIDGAKIYADQFSKETDAAKKKELAALIDGLFIDAIKCHEDGVITTKRSNQQNISSLYATWANHMYYTLRTPYAKTLETYTKALELGGDNATYGVVAPMAAIAVYEFQKGNLDRAVAAGLYDKLTVLCEGNTEHKYADYYKQAMGAMKGEYNKVEKEVFDCSYFVEEYKMAYGTEPADIEYDELKVVIALLKRQGCVSGEPYLDALEKSYSARAGAINASRQAEFNANNPGMVANKMYKSGDFQGAINKYREAINAEGDNVQKSKYHFSIASILFRKMKKYSDARSEARKAAQLDPSSGKPYVLIGDMYSTTARNCGDSWNQSLAVIAAMEKWRKGSNLNLDDRTLEQANKKIRTYRSSLPNKEDGFMKGIQPGQKQRVGCWIGETVSVTYK